MRQGFNETSVTVTGLRPVTTYRFQVYAENGVSGFDKGHYADITVKTDAFGWYCLYRLMCRLHFVGHNLQGQGPIEDPDDIGRRSRFFSAGGVSAVSL